MRIEAKGRNSEHFNLDFVPSGHQNEHAGQTSVISQRKTHG
jgi:hypothetical protein